MLLRLPFPDLLERLVLAHLMEDVLDVTSHLARRVGARLLTANVEPVNSLGTQVLSVQRLQQLSGWQSAAQVGLRRTISPFDHGLFCKR